MLYTDLRELKKVLEIDPDKTDEDSKLLFFIEYASDIIESILDRPGLSYKQRTEFYCGTGTQKLLLKSRPVFLPMTVLVDEGGFYGSTTNAFDPTICTLEYGRDYFLRIDQEDGSSRSAILYRLRAAWPKPAYRQQGWLSPYIGPDFGSIKITYTAGYTVDTLPAAFRYACNLLVAKMRGLLPVGMEMSSESYQDRSMAFAPNQRDYLMSLAKPHILLYRNWTF